jgi:hypothetical protein
VVREHLGRLFAEMDLNEALLVEDARSHRHVSVFSGLVEDLATR